MKRYAIAKASQDMAWGLTEGWEKVTQIFHSQFGDGWVQKPRKLAKGLAPLPSPVYQPLPSSQETKREPGMAVKCEQERQPASVTHRRVKRRYLHISSVPQGPDTGLAPGLKQDQVVCWE